jgi:methylglutaconyl-CoA hydratase
MTNPISDPLVENVISDDVATAPVALDATANGVATVTLQRADSRNAFDGSTIAALTEIFETLHGAEGVRIVFLRGEGGHFSAGDGHDWMRMGIDWSADDNRRDALASAALLKALNDIPALTVALVEGDAFGLGAGLVAACDMAIAARDASFAFPDVKSGLIPAVVSPYVIRAIGPRRATALFATGAALDAERARAMGLVGDVVADGAALSAAKDALVSEILTSAPGAVAEVKHLVRDVTGEPIGHALLEETARRMARTRFEPEGREGLAAFLAERKPDWASS